MLLELATTGSCLTGKWADGASTLPEHEIWQMAPELEMTEHGMLPELTTTGSRNNSKRLANGTQIVQASRRVAAARTHSDWQLVPQLCQNLKSD